MYIYIYYIYYIYIYIYVFHSLSDVKFKFYIVTFQKKSNIRKASFVNQKSPCYPLKMFKLLKNRDKRSNNVGKTAIIFA